MKEKKLSEALSLIAWGYLLIHLHFNIGTIDILPDWLGYIFFYSAINVIQREEPTAKLLQPLAIILAIWNILTIFFGDIGLISTIIAILSLYFHFQFLTDLANLAGKYVVEEKETLLQLRTVRTILMTIFAIPIPWEEWGVVTIILLIVNLVVAFWICKVLFTFRNRLKDIGA